MRRLVFGFCAVLLALSGAGPFAGSAHARPAADSGPMVTALVVLATQVDAARVAGPRHLRRSSVVERSLRATAANTQRAVLAMLRERQRYGLVSSVVPLWIVNAVSVTAAPSVIRELAARPDVREVAPEQTFPAPARPSASSPASRRGAPRFRAADADPAVPSPVEPNVARVNAPALWDLGYRGQGVVVANLDTGVDASHPDLSGRWRGGTNSWYDPYGEHPTVPTDINGHGTATMGVMVGGDAGGTAIGVAPGATWIAAKIFNDRGSATSTAIHLAFQWLLDPDGDPATADAPDVVNDSWTLSSGGCVADFRPDLANLRAAGILPVFAAGNYGPTAGTVLSPANNPEALAVGATDNADVLDPSSSRGPSACGAGTWPQLVAPGVGVHTTDLYGYYTDASGTSLAAPHVAGALALLLSAVPDAPADRQAAALAGGAVDLGVPGPDADYGYGRLDALAAYQYLTTVPDFTVAASPGSARTVPGGTVTYQLTVSAANGFTGDVSLALSGLPGAVGAATFDPPVVTAGAGTAQLTVTTLAGAPFGSYSLTITGTGGSRVHSAFATLVVSAPPDFGLAASPASRTVNAGGVAAYTVTVSARNGFTGAVALSVSGLPSGASVSFAPNPVGAPGSSTLTVRTTASTVRGTFTLVVTGTSGLLTHQVTATLTVR